MNRNKTVLLVCAALSVFLIVAGWFVYHQGNRWPPFDPPILAVSEKANVETMQSVPEAHYTVIESTTNGIYIRTSPRYVLLEEPCVFQLEAFAKERDVIKVRCLTGKESGSTGWLFIHEISNK